MADLFSRTVLLIGEEGIDKLAIAKVAVLGIGGVGSYAVEALARAGVGSLVLVDPDFVETSNINRQLQATLGTIGKAKVLAMKERVLSINPGAMVDALQLRYGASSAQTILAGRYDYIIDAMDDVSAKVDLILRAKKLHIPMISCMGTGNRIDAIGFQVADISESWGCPLARIVRRRLKDDGVTQGVKVVFSGAPPIKPLINNGCSTGQTVVGSISYVPPVAGLLMAGECVRQLLQ